jgi:carbon storage regulator
MLVLSRKLNQRIVIDRDIILTLVGIGGNQVRLGIEAPATVRIFREELCDRVGTKRQRRATGPADAAN